MRADPDRLHGREAALRTRSPTELARRLLALRLGLVVGAALVLVGAGATAISGVVAKQQAPVEAVGNRPVNTNAVDLTDITANNSPTLVRNPRDGRELAVATRIDSPRFSCALYLSRDGGRRWAPIPIPVPGGGRAKCFAPDVTFDASGKLYLSFVTLGGRGNLPRAAWMSRLDGDTLSKPVKLLGPLSFQVRLVADPVEPGRLYLTWLEASDVGLYQFSETGNPVAFMRSDDGGRSWGERVTVSPPQRERVVAPSLAVGRDGELYVLYLDLGDDQLDYAGAHEGRGGPPYPGPWALTMARSTDGGRTWEDSVVDPGLKPIERIIVFIPPFPSLAADPDSGRLYASFQDARLGDADVLLWTSSDAGRSWGEPQRVNDTAPGDGTAQYLPKLAVAPNGRLDILYYDRRRDQQNVFNEVSIQSSTDGGATFSEHLRVSERRFDSRIGFGAERQLPDLGSRLGLVSADTAALAVWADTRAGTEASLKQDIASVVVRFSRPARLGGSLEAGLRYGGVALALLGLTLLASPVLRRRRARRRPTLDP